MLAMFRAHMHVLACRQLGVNDIQGEQWALNSKYNNSNYYNNNTLSKCSV